MINSIIINSLLINSLPLIYNYIYILDITLPPSLLTHTTGTQRLCAPSCRPAHALLPLCAFASGPGCGLRPSACATATAQGPFWDRCAPWLFFTCTLHFSTLCSWLRQALHCASAV